MTGIPIAPPPRGAARTPGTWLAGTVYCLGKNYRLHAIEMGQNEERAPVVFVKPAAALVPLDRPIVLPRARGTVHHELELVLALKFPDEWTGGPLDPAAAAASIAAVTVGLDLTLRDEQAAAKAAGEPWAASKGFPGSAPIAPLLLQESLSPSSVTDLAFSLAVNGRPAQAARVRDMLLSPAAAVAHLSWLFPLASGDLVFTGTPHGVGPLAPGDSLEVTLEGWMTVATSVGE